MNKSWLKNSGKVLAVIAFISLALQDFGPQQQASAFPIDYKIVLEILRTDSAWAKASPDGCSPPPKGLRNVDCSKEPDATKSKCQLCHQSVMKYFNGANEKGHLAYDACKGVTCKGLGAGDSVDAQRALMEAAKAKDKDAVACFGAKVGHNKDVEDSAKECGKAHEGCSGLSGENQSIVSKNKKECKKAEQDAKDTGKDQKQKKDESQGQQGKNDDNAKKEGGGGQMPQMPQIPQQQQSQDQQPQQQADYPQATSPTPGSDNKEKQEIAESKFDEDKDKSAIPAVGFGNTTPVGTATVTSPGPSATAQGFDPSRNPSNSNGFGDKPQGGAVAATGLPQGGGGGGGLNSSGASLPGGGQGAGDGEKKPNEANPYEVPVGSGGRLGAPKGKSGGESDSALDTAATSAFKDDFKADPNAAGAGNGADMASAGAEEDGYSIFKMIKYRYTELKKRGSI